MLATKKMIPTEPPNSGPSALLIMTDQGQGFVHTVVRTTLIMMSLIHIIVIVTVIQCHTVSYSVYYIVTCCVRMDGLYRVTLQVG